MERAFVLVFENNHKGHFEILETKYNMSFFLSHICSDRLKKIILNGIISLRLILFLL